jgi:hypothetical protein
MISIAQIKWINRNLNIEDFLSELGVHIPMNRKVFCPFHHNVNSPAAVIYESRDGSGGVLRCYTEQRTYRTYDVIKLLGYSEEEIKRMVPREHWYTPEEERELVFELPVVDEAERILAGNVFAFLDKLNSIWNDNTQ